MKTPDQIKRDIIQDCLSNRTFDPSKLSNGNERKISHRQAQVKPRNERDAYYMKSWIGKWCSFIMEMNGTESRFAGCITKIEPIEHIGNVPNYRLTVTGRTGKVASVNLLLQHARIFDTQEKAIEDTKL